MKKWVLVILFVLLSQALGDVCFSAPPKHFRTSYISGYRLWLRPGYEKLADWIYIIEGGSHTRHPYGIMKKYKHTTPRQACINTLKTNWKKYEQYCEGSTRYQSKDFLEFLAERYAPIGAKNDPNGLNKNWLKNLQAMYDNWYEKHEAALVQGEIDSLQEPLVRQAWERERTSREIDEKVAEGVREAETDASILRDIYRK